MVHSQFVRRDQLQRYVEYKIIPSFFTPHTFYFGDAHVQLRGKAQADFLSPMRAAIDLGLRPTNHTDFVVTPLDQMFVVWTAVNRVSRSGAVIGADQRVTPLEALQGDHHQRRAPVPRGRPEGLTGGRQARRSRCPGWQSADGGSDGDQGHPGGRDHQGRPDRLPGEVSRAARREETTMKRTCNSRSSAALALIAAGAICASPLFAQDDAARGQEALQPGRGTHQRARAAQLQPELRARRGRRQWAFNIQPVVPIEMGKKWNVISRTILPVVSQHEIYPGAGSQSGISDIVQACTSRPRSRRPADGSGAPGRSSCCRPAATTC